MISWLFIDSSFILCRLGHQATTSGSPIESHRGFFDAIQSLQLDDFTDFNMFQHVSTRYTFSYFLYLSFFLYVFIIFLSFQLYRFLMLSHISISWKSTIASAQKWRLRPWNACGSTCTTMTQRQGFCSLDPEDGDQLCGRRMKRMEIALIGSLWSGS